MDGETETVGQGVIVKQEHAYASKENSGIIQSHNSTNDDPLQILPCDLDKVKIENDSEMLENVEIKVESESWDEQLCMPNADIPEYVTDLNEISDVNIPDIFDISNLEDNATWADSDFVPKAAFSDLQDKFKVENKAHRIRYVINYFISEFSDTLHLICTGKENVYFTNQYIRIRTE